MRTDDEADISQVLIHFHQRDGKAIEDNIQSK